MSDVETADEEPQLSTGSQMEVPKGRRSLSRMRRELTDEEMASGGVAKVLLDDTERLQSEVNALREMANKYFSADKQLAVMETRLKQKTAFETLVDGALIIGSLLAGFAYNAWSNQPTGWIILISGALLVGVGLVARIMSR